MKTAAKPLPPPQGPLATRQGHDELNFAEFPLVLLAKRPAAGMQSIEYQDDYTDPNGKLVTRRVTISGAGKYGLPNPQDEDVLIALMYLTLLDKQKLEPAQGGDPDGARTIHFTRPQLFQILGWPDTGDSYERLKKSLRRWKGVTIVYENWASLTSSGERHGTDETGFSLLDNYQLADARSRPKDSPEPTLPFADLPVPRALCSITWNKTPFASFQSGYLKTLDLDRYFQLPTPAAKRAFRYLDKRLPPAGAEEFDLDRFACQHVGFSTRYKPSRLRQDVEQTVIRPLEQAEFIAPMSPQERFPKRAGRYRVIFARAGQQALAGHESGTPAPLLSTGAGGPVELALKQRGLGGKAARDLIAAYPIEHIQQKIDYLDFLSDNEEAPKKPAGWLRAAIVEDYGPPAGYLQRTDRLRQQQAAAETRRQKEEEQIARRRQNEQEAALRKMERAHIDAYLKRLSPEERQALEEQAIAHADEEMRRAAQSGDDLGRIARSLLLDREVLERCPFSAVQL